MKGVYIMDKTKEVVNDRLFEEVFNSDLSDKEKKFVLYYLESYNATQSYLKAFGGNKSNATFLAYQLLHRRKIISQVKKLKKILQIGFDVDPSRYIEFLLKSANADIGDYIKFSEEEVVQYGNDGCALIDPDTGEQITKKVNKMHLVNSDEIDTSVITSIKQGRDGITIQLVDKLKCWEKIKEFFEWKKSQEEKSVAETNIIEALKNNISNTWTKDEIYDDLEETLKEDN